MEASAAPAQQYATVPPIIPPRATTCAAIGRSATDPAPAIDAAATALRRRLRRVTCVARGGSCWHELVSWFGPRGSCVAAASKWPKERGTSGRAPGSSRNPHGATGPAQYRGAGARAGAARARQGTILPGSVAYNYELPGIIYLPAGDSVLLPATTPEFLRMMQDLNTIDEFILTRTPSNPPKIYINQR